MEKSQRRSGIELLRIIAMMQIIVLHIFNFGKLTYSSNQIGGLPLASADLLWAFCRSPVNVFILISGYFLVERSFDLRATGKRIWNLYKVMLFYSVSISIVFWIKAPYLLGDSFSENIAETAKTLLPFSSRTWYFLTLFILVTALAPFINLALQKLSQRQYLVLLIITFLMTSLWPVLSALEPTKGIISVKTILDVEKGKSLYSFIFMYILGGYLKRFIPENGKNKFRYLFMFIFCCISDFALNFISSNDSGSYSDVFGWYSNPLVIFEAVFIFLFFRSLNFKSGFVNKVSSGVLGVYIIHEFRYVRSYIWQHISFKSWDGNIPDMLIKTIIIVLGIFTLCNACELIRSEVFKFISQRVKGNKTTK